MTIEKLNIKFRGFHPTKDELNIINSTIHEIEKNMPDGSQVKVLCAKKDLLYKIVLTLNSSAKLFIAVSHGKLLNEALTKSLKQARKKIERIKVPSFHRSHKYLEQHA